MKTFALLLLTTLPLFAQDYYECPPAYENAPCYERCAPSFFECGFKYIKLGGSIISIGQQTGGGVNIGVGYRFIEGCSAADFSLQYMVGRASDDSSAYTYLTPSLRYLHYVQPRVYVGGGLAYGGTGVRGHKFNGITVNLTAGYEIFRGQRMSQFIELDFVQPAIRTSKKKETLYAPSLALSFGMGF